jgi:hypothetical protein
MPLYEVELRFPDREEIRVTDRLLVVGTTFVLGAYEWLVEDEQPIQGAVAVARYVCKLLRSVDPPF